MFHACVQRFDGMDEKILDGKLNRALVLQKFYKIFQILHHIESLDVCMEY